VCVSLPVCMRARPMFRRGLLGGCFCMRVHVLQPQGKCVPVCVPADASNQSVKKFVRAQAHGRLPLSLPVCLYCLQPVNKSCSYSHILMLIQSCTRLCTIIFLYLHLLIQSCTRLCTIISLCLHLLIQIMHSSLHNHILVFAFAYTDHALVFAQSYPCVCICSYIHALVFAQSYSCICICLYNHALVFAQSYPCVCICLYRSCTRLCTIIFLYLHCLHPIKSACAYTTAFMFVFSAACKAPFGHPVPKHEDAGDFQLAQRHCRQQARVCVLASGQRQAGPAV